MEGEAEGPRQSAYLAPARALFAVDGAEEDRERFVALKRGAMVLEKQPW